MNVCDDTACHLNMLYVARQQEHNKIAYKLIEYKTVGNFTHDTELKSVIETIRPFIVLFEPLNE